jgi:hypothetical protein
MKKIVKFLKNINLFFTPKVPELGRWSLKTHNMTHINSIYQNRDHCGDTICKKPIKANKYIS